VLLMHLAVLVGRPRPGAPEIRRGPISDWPDARRRHLRGSTCCTPWPGRSKRITPARPAKRPCRGPECPPARHAGSRTREAAAQDTCVARAAEGAATGNSDVWSGAVQHRATQAHRFDHPRTAWTRYRESRGSRRQSCAKAPPGRRIRSRAACHRPLPPPPATKAIGVSIRQTATATSVQKTSEHARTAVSDRARTDRHTNRLSIHPNASSVEPCRPQTTRRQRKSAGVNLRPDLDSGSALSRHPPTAPAPRTSPLVASRIGGVAPDLLALTTGA